jgi:hypothetical protein
MFDTWQGAAFADRTVFAAVPPEAFLAGLGAVIAFLVGAFVIACVVRWRKRRRALEKPEEDLEAFHALYEQGQLSREELERIRARLASRRHPELPENDS